MTPDERGEDLECVDAARAARIAEIREGFMARANAERDGLAERLFVAWYGRKQGYHYTLEQACKAYDAADAFLLEKARRAGEVPK